MMRRWWRDVRLSRCLRAAARGDTRGFDQLFDELYPLVAAFVTRRVGRSQEAEDLVAATLHEVLERLGEFDPERGSVVTWTLVIARSKLVDHARQRKRTLALYAGMADDAGELVAGPEQLDALLFRERREHVAALVDGLPVATRELLALRFGDELSCAEIAKVIGVDERTVRQRISRALRALRTRFEESKKVSKSCTN